MHNEFWSSKNPTAELTVMRELSEVEDHKITIIGPDLDQAKDLALATYVEVAGKKMQVDFEAEKAGKVTAVLVQVGESVMEDTPLVVIE